MAKNVLVTGASGFIGGKLCSKLTALGWNVTGIGRRAGTQDGYVSWDLKNPLPAHLDRSWDVVIHAAARSSPWGTAKEYEDANIVATKNIIDFCKRNSFPKLVFISSSSVFYQECHQLGLTENSPLAPVPVNRYAETKQRGEKLVSEYPAPWVILRPRAVFGPGDTVLLPRIVEAAEKGKLPILTTRGAPTIGDLIYIDNLVDYIVSATELPQVQGCYNLTNNEPIEISSFVLSILERLNIAPPKRKVSVQKAMVAATCLEWFYRIFLPTREPPITRFGVHVFAYSKTFDVSKSIRDMGNPRVSLEEGVRRVVDDYMANKRIR